MGQRPGVHDEAIDPVRFISNRSSGKMGYAIARAAAAEGAKVILVSGPVNLAEPAGIDVVRVQTAEEMYTATHDRIADVDIFIAAAAVYFTLIKVLVRPMMRITRNMLHFGEDPEDASRIIEPGRRADEIGIAEGELARMQTQLNQLLHQRRRLAERPLRALERDAQRGLLRARLPGAEIAQLAAGEDGGRGGGHHRSHALLWRRWRPGRGSGHGYPRRC